MSIEEVIEIFRDEEAVKLRQRKNSVLAQLYEEIEQLEKMLAGVSKTLAEVRRTIIQG